MNKLLVNLMAKHDKKTYPKLMFNTLKVMGNPTFIYTHWAFSSHVAHVHAHAAHVHAHVAHVHPCVNHE
jgi:hypothetical protein